MNEYQYNLIKSFLAMGNSVKRIATEWRIKRALVVAVAGTASYKQFKARNDDDLMSKLGDILGL